MENAEPILIAYIFSDLEYATDDGYTCRQTQPSPSITHRIPPSMENITHYINQLVENITRYINQLTFKPPNSPTQTHVLHQDSPTQSNSTLPPPSFSTRRGSSTQSRLENSLIRHARWVGEKLANRGRRTSFAQNPATTTD